MHDKTHDELLSVFRRAKTVPTAVNLRELSLNPSPRRERHLQSYFTASPLTPDFMIDCLNDGWTTLRQRFPHSTTLVLTLANDPENHSRRTPFMQRLAAFTDRFQVPVELAYYPPYHSHYNPIERVWDVLEKHWNGSLLDSCQILLHFAQTMTFRARLPSVPWLKMVYQTGVRLTQKQMAQLKHRFQRLPGLAQWFVRIVPLPL